MPQERSPEHTSDSSVYSGLPRKTESEPRRDQPLGEAHLLADGTPPPPYPSVLDLNDVTEGHLALATQDLLNYIGGMRQRAEQRANRSRAHAASQPERKSEPDSSRADLRDEEPGPTGRVLSSRPIPKIR